MANSKITWANKESLVTDPTIAEKNKVTDSNMNEIKNVVNENADQVIVSETEPTSTDNEIWVDTSSNATYINSEISNEYGTSQKLGYSQEYINKVTEYSTTEQVIGKWTDGKTLYRKVITSTIASGHTSAEVNINVPNFGYVIKADVRFNPIGSADYVYGAYYSGATDYMRFFMRNNMLQIRLGSNSNGFNIVAILEYTKTTD